MKLFQIKEDDLAELERLLPAIMVEIYPHLTPAIRTRFRSVQRIMSEVRWDYGPPGDVEVIDASE